MSGEMSIDGVDWNMSQRRALYGVLKEPGMHVIAGPPRSGKTSMMFTLFRCLFDPLRRALVVCADETVVERLIRQGSGYSWWDALRIKAAVRGCRNPKIQDFITDYWTGGTGEELESLDLDRVQMVITTWSDLLWARQVMEDRVWHPRSVWITQGERVNERQVCMALSATVDTVGLFCEANEMRAKLRRVDVPYDRDNMQDYVFSAQLVANHSHEIRVYSLSTQYWVAPELQGMSKYDGAYEVGNEIVHWDQPLL